MATRNLRSFRKGIAVLKRAGLVTGVDARKVRPTPKLEKLLTKFDDVISGKATAVKLSPEETRKRKKMGDQVVSVVSGRTGKARKSEPKRVIIPHAATEKVTVKKDQVVTTRRTPGGGRIARRDVPIEYHNLEQYLEDLRNVPSEPGKWYCMRVFADYTHCYRDIQALLDEFTKYKTVIAAESGRPKEQLEYYRNLQIVTVDNPMEGEVLRNNAMQARRHKHPKQSSKAKYKRRMAKLKAGPPFKLAEYKRKNAARVRRWRERHGK